MSYHSHLHVEPLEDRIAPAGLVTVTYSSATGALTLVGDDLDNSLDVVRTGVNTHRIEGLNGTLLTSNGGSVPLLDIGKLTSLTINGNGGADDSGLTDLTLKTLKFAGGAGLDFVISTNLAVKGDVDLNLGADGALIAFGGTSTNIGGDVCVTNVDGVSSVDFFASTTSIKGTVKLAGGTGEDAFSFTNIVNVDKGIAISDAGGGMKGAFREATAVIGKKHGDSIDFAGGTGVDSFKIVGGNVTLKGDLEFDGGAGADLLETDAAVLKVEGKVIGIGGADDDVIKIGGTKVTLGHWVSLSGGDGADELALSADQLKVAGAVVLRGGDGDDSLNVLADVLSLRRSLTMLGGNGANVGTVFGDGLIKGDVYLGMGGAAGGGDQTFLIGGVSGAVGALKLGGELTVKSRATDPLSQGFSDFFWATDVTVADDVEIAMGAVDSSVLLDNVFLRRTLDINTGAGDDRVEIERNALPGPSTIARLASIQVGEGDDVVLIGRSSAAGSNSYVIFKGGLRVDGGPGTDTSNDFLNDTVNVFLCDDDCHDDDDDDDRRHHDDDDHEHDDDDDDDDKRGWRHHEWDDWFDWRKRRCIKERINFEGPFVV